MKKDECCGEVSTSDPRAFGPVLWPALFVTAQNYPYDPSPETRTKCEAFMDGLPYMLPCGECGGNLKTFIDTNSANDGSMLTEACSSRDDLVSFVARAHNNVSQHTRPNEKPLTPQDIESKFSSRHTCLTAKVWHSANPIDR